MAFQKIPNALSFWQHVALTADIDRCWEWQGHISRFGYGTAPFQGKRHLAHRLAWFFFYGQEPKGLACHHCDNRKCVNPHHLYEGTHQSNSADMARRGRAMRGSKHIDARLTEADIPEIIRRWEQGESQASLAREYLVGATTLSHVVHRRNWRHINIDTRGGE